MVPEADRVTIVKDDKEALRRDFPSYKPKYPVDREAIVKAVPHDMFCKDDGFMLTEHGEVWLDEKGNINR